MKKLEIEIPDDFDDSVLNRYLKPKREKYPKDWTESQKRARRRRMKKAIDEMPKSVVMISYVPDGVKIEYGDVTPQKHPKS